MLIPTLAQLSLQQGTDLQKVAIVADVREGTFLSQFPTVWRRLKRMPRLQPSLIFLEATHAALVRRFSETRRPHPLAADRSVSEGIHDERGRLDVIRSMADAIVDTSELTVHELRNRFLSFARDQSQRSPLIVSLVSFGFKHGAAARRRPRVRRAIPAEPALRAAPQTAHRARQAGRRVSSNGTRSPRSS